jgi:hypothetical protein
MNKLKHLLYLTLVPISLFSQSEAEQAVIDAIEIESRFITKMSFADLVKNFWIEDEHTCMLLTLAGGNVSRIDTAAIHEMNDIPEENNAIVKKYNYRIDITDEVAYATFEQSILFVDGSQIFSHEMRILRKKEGVWKIHVSSVHLYENRD